ncbi:hypothetical protein [Aliikangiella sp. G2MR2-5]|uniref:hypothetical protein n=1 Tax=Aliikangiella sp. G2MR2-5 TaxID=2788943 RepID=UPI0018AA6C53|nr:hypothetical protein [Aliikangiella sp. G2MR2-5]
MIQLGTIFILLYAGIATIAWFKAKKRNALFWTDISAPILVVVFWVIITSFGYGHQSLSHFVEVPIALLFSLIALFVRVFILDNYSKKYRRNSVLVLALSLMFVFVLRTFMPYLPE